METAERDEQIEREDVLREARKRYNGSWPSLGSVVEGWYKQAVISLPPKISGTDRTNYLIGEIARKRDVYFGKS